MHTNPQTIIYTANDSDLDAPEYYCFLWRKVRREKLPRREWLDLLADTFRDYEGQIFWPSGEIYDLPDLDAAFGDDPSFRWLGWYLEGDSTGPRHKSRQFERLRILDLYFKIRYLELSKVSSDNFPNFEE